MQKAWGISTSVYQLSLNYKHPHKHLFPEISLSAAMPPSVPAHIFNALKRFTSCDVRLTLSPLPPPPPPNLSSQVGDALIKLNVRYGGYLHGLRMYSPTPQTCATKIFGPAYTVQMVDAADTASPKPTQHFVDGVSKDEVVFISQPGGFYSACWGGLMTTRAKYLGAKGVVVDGNVRDLGEHREMGFPVSTHFCKTQRKRY